MTQRSRFLLLFVAALALCAPLAASASGVGSQAQFLAHHGDSSWDVTRARGRTTEVDFETDEGTWMSVDISPDGHWLVFDMLGQIYRMPAHGGKADCLTQGSGVALNYHPRISPDGRTIAFISDRGGQANLWLMDVDGGNPHVLFSDPVSQITSPTWTPDSRAVIAVREFPTYSMHRRSARIWRFPVAGGDTPEELVGSPSGSQAYWPSVSPDGRWLYYMSSTFAEPLHGLQRNQHLMRLDLVTRAVSTVTPATAEREYRPGTNNEYAPEVSPDGRWLTYAKRIPGGSITYRSHTFNERNALWIRDLSTGRDRILADPITLDMQGAHGMKNLRIMPGYSWAKDSGSLVLWNDGKLHRLWLDGRMEDIPFVARVRRVVSQRAQASAPIRDDAFDARYLHWPSRAVGDTLVFEAVGEIWVAGLRDGAVKAHPLIAWSPDAAYFTPNVSPDGRRLAYVSWNDSTLGGVWVCGLPACSPVKWSHEARRYLYPTWTPDRDRLIAFRSRTSDAERISTRDNVGYDLVEISGATEKVVREQVVPSPLSIGPDGRLFHIVRKGDVDIQAELTAGRSMSQPMTVLSSMAPDGSGAERAHVSFPSAIEAAPSPDGRWVAFVEDYELYVAPFYRSEAEYADGEAFHWRGDALPQAIVKENPKHGARKVSFGGADHVRWLDSHHLIFTSGPVVSVYDVDTEKLKKTVVQATVRKPAPPPGRRVAFTGARIITMVQDRVIESGSLVVDGGRIVCVGVCSLVDVEKIIDARGKTILPGFIDVHAHGGFATTDVFPQHLAPQSLYLAHGVTTALDPSVSSAAFFPVSELIEAGRLVGPRSFATGEALTFEAPATGPVSYADSEALIRRLSNYGARSIKVFLTPRRDQRQMLADWARILHLSVTNEGADLYYNVGSILDGHTGFEHPMHNMVLYRDAVEFFGRAHAVYSPTIIVAGAGRWAEEYQKSRQDLWHDPIMSRFLPWQELALHRDTGVHPIEDYSFPILAEDVRDIRRHGGYASIGGHGELWGRDSQWEMWSYAAAAPPMEVLQMATRDGAEMLGLRADLGSLEPGKIADVVVLDANPLLDIHNTLKLRYVMKSGVLYDAPTLDQLWPRAVPYGVPPWYRPDILRPSAAAPRSSGG